MPTCGLRRGSKGGPARPIFIITRLKTLARGQASQGERHGTSSGAASSGWLTRRRRNQGGVHREVPLTQAMTTQGARRAPARAASFFPLWCKGGKRSRGVPRHQAKVAILVQQDQDQSNGGKEVIMEPRTASPQGLWQARTNFSQDKCTRCSPSNWPIVGAHPAQYLGRGPGPLPINRTSHPQGRGSSRKPVRKTQAAERERRVAELPLAVHRPSQEQTLARLFFPVLFIIISPRGNPPATHWSRVLHHNGGPNQYKPCVSCVVLSVV